MTARMTSHSLTITSMSYFTQQKKRIIMDSTRIDTVASEQIHEKVYAYAAYHSIITGVDRYWEYGGFALPDGSYWRYREPNAAVIVEGDRLRVRVEQLTRFNDRVQILDNAKNMFF